MILQAMGPYTGNDYDSDDDYVPSRLDLRQLFWSALFLKQQPHLNLDYPKMMAGAEGCEKKNALSRELCI